MTDVRPPIGFDTAATAPAQDVWTTADIRRGHLRLRTLIRARWMVIFGEVLVLAGIGLVLGHQAPFGACALIVVAGAMLNAITTRAWSSSKILSDREAVLQLGFDVVQISSLVALTGGSGNPFVLGLVAPVTLAAASLPLRPLSIIAGLAALSGMLLAVFALPYPHVRMEFFGLPLWSSPDPMLTLEYRLTASLAIVAGILLVAGIVRQSVVEAARMALALDVTRSVLAREQKLSALGTLAAAAAHELGTPLATISIVAKELAREAPNAAVREDANLLIAQAERCRDILKRLAAMPDKAADDIHDRLSLRELVQEVIEPHAGMSQTVRVEAIVTGAKGVRTPAIRRLPEITHAFNSFVENAVDFAHSEILVSARFDADFITIEVRDDGPGFAPEVLGKLGEPYLTSRPNAEGSPTGHIGLGLGFFISKTLLERTGAVVTYNNVKPRGALVAATWKRSDLEVA